MKSARKRDLKLVALHSEERNGCVRTGGREHPRKIEDGIVPMRQRVPPGASQVAKGRKKGRSPRVRWDVAGTQRQGAGVRASSRTGSFSARRQGASQRRVQNRGAVKIACQAAREGKYKRKDGTPKNRIGGCRKEGGTRGEVMHQTHL